MYRGFTPGPLPRQHAASKTLQLQLHCWDRNPENVAPFKTIADKQAAAEVLGSPKRSSASSAPPFAARLMERLPDKASPMGSRVTWEPLVDFFPVVFLYGVSKFLFSALALA